MKWAGGFATCPGRAHFEQGGTYRLGLLAPVVKRRWVQFRVIAVIAHGAQPPSDSCEQGVRAKVSPAGVATGFRRSANGPGHDSGLPRHVMGYAHGRGFVHVCRQTAGSLFEKTGGPSHTAEPARKATTRRAGRKRVLSVGGGVAHLSVLWPALDQPHERTVQGALEHVGHSPQQDQRHEGAGAQHGLGGAEDGAHGPRPARLRIAWRLWASCPASSPDEGTGPAATTSRERGCRACASCRRAGGRPLETSVARRALRVHRGHQ